MKSIPEIKRAITDAGKLGYNTSFLTGFAENITGYELRDTRRYKIGNRFKRSDLTGEFLICALGVDQNGIRRIGAFNVDEGTRLHSELGIPIKGHFAEITTDEIRAVLNVGRREDVLLVR